MQMAQTQGCSPLQASIFWATQTVGAAATVVRGRCQTRICAVPVLGTELWMTTDPRVQGCVRVAGWGGASRARLRLEKLTPGAVSLGN